MEGTEQFQVSLSAPTNATILDGGFGTIIDDDVRSVSIDDVTVTEGIAEPALPRSRSRSIKPRQGRSRWWRPQPPILRRPGLTTPRFLRRLTFSPGTTQQTFSVPIVAMSRCPGNDGTVFRESEQM